METRRRERRTPTGLTVIGMEQESFKAENSRDAPPDAAGVKNRTLRPVRL